MEYNRMHYKVFKLIKGKYEYKATFYTHHEAYRYTQTHQGVYIIEKEMSVD
jgi:hypothetical protein